MVRASSFENRGINMEQATIVTGSIQNGEILTADEAAKYLGVSYETLKRARYTSKLNGQPAPKHLRLNYRTVVYRKTTLDEWLNALEEFETGAEANTYLKAS